MLRLLTIELHKLRYNKSAKVISIVYFILITFIALISSIEFNFGAINFRIADQGIFNFPYIWHFNSYIAAILKLFLAIVIVSMTANEYSNKTLKQNLIDGLSKKEFILGGQGNLWTEYIKTPEKAEYMVLPRMSAMAEVLWSSKKNRDYDSFTHRMNWQYKRLDRMKVNYRKPD